MPSALPLLGLICAAMLLTHSLWPGLALPNKLHFFLAGTLAGLLPRNATRAGQPVWVLSALQILAIVVLASPHFLYANKEAFYASVECAIAFAVAVYILTFSSPWTIAVSTNPMIRRISQASFSIYLLHVMVFYFGARLMGMSHEVFDFRWILLGLAGVAIPMVVSHYLEMPLQKLVRKRLESSLIKTPRRTTSPGDIEGSRRGT